MAISTTYLETREDVARLEEVLEDELALTNRLLDSMREKQLVLTTWRMDDLAATVGREEDLFSEFAELEEGRRHAIDELSQTLGGIDGDVTLAELIERLGLRPESRLARLGTLLTEASKELSEMNMSNALLARNMIEYISLVLRLFTHESDRTNYNASGAVKNEGLRRNILNRKV